MSIIERAAQRLSQPTAREHVDQHAAQPAAVSPAPPSVAPAVDPAVTPSIAPSIHPAEGRTSPSKQVAIDLERLESLGMVTPHGGRKTIAEEFRVIKRDLISKAFESPGPNGNPNNLIMVTSSLPGEGKTFCAVNLAISIAMELDHTVMLVDADVARPSVLQTLGISRQQGLMELLLDKNLDVGDVMLKTNINTLSVLPSGSNHRHATELLASQTMSKLLGELASRYPDRIVIFDSPPLLITSEARVLASQMGQIVFTVEGEKTTQSSLRNSLRHLERCQNVNLLFNKARAFHDGDRYGYYY
ncbi:MAG: XrtA-associated tyrosine autokinase [Burkholderiaceae bacterium]